MERPQRTKISTRRLSEFYYPNEKRKNPPKKQLKNDKSNPKRKQNQLKIQESPPIALPTPPNLILPDPIPATANQAVQTEKKRELTENDLIEQLYTNPKFPPSYSASLKQYLLQKESLSRHKKRFNVFKRRQVYVGGPWTAIQADTIHYREYGTKNSGFKYILVVIDTFSRRVWCRAMKTVTAKETAANLDQIISKMEFIPRTFSSDKAKVYQNTVIKFKLLAYLM